MDAEREKELMSSLSTIIRIAQQMNSDILSGNKAWLSSMFKQLSHNVSILKNKGDFER